MMLPSKNVGIVKLGLEKYPPFFKKKPVRKGVENI